MKEVDSPKNYSPIAYTKEKMDNILMMDDEEIGFNPTFLSIDEID